MIDISCGENFSVALAESGEVYSWGHSEYNQHGQLSNASTDYVDPFHYFTPRRVESASSILARGEKIVRVYCGANFTVAATDRGNCCSWGWGQGGVLGRGRGMVSSEPNVLYSLGNEDEDKAVALLAAGSTHVVCSTKQHRSPWAAMQFADLLKPEILEASADIEMYIEGVAQPILGHTMILAARSAYLRGYITQAMQHRTTEGSPSAERMAIELPAHPRLNPASLRSLLVYIYTDRVSVKPHKRQELGDLSLILGVPGLAYLSDRREKRTQSTFTSDLETTLCSDSFQDVYFYTNDYPSESESGVEPRTIVLRAHKFLLCHFMPYFRPFFYSGFAEASATNDNAAWICIDSFSVDGIEATTFAKLVRFAYSGVCEELACVSSDVQSDEDIHEVMALLIAASRFGFAPLVQICEKKLLSCVKDSHENAVAMQEFANSYNFPFLEHSIHVFIQSKVNCGHWDDSC